MNKGIGILFGLVLILAANTVCFGAQTIVAQRVMVAPVIDGKGTDPVWSKAETITTHDKVADIDVTVKAVYTGNQIFFLVIFTDPDESRKHKPLIWDKAMEIYKTGSERGDCFIFKWSMETGPVDLSVYADKPYKADIWFWKADRTDPVGYADDKHHIFSKTKIPKSVKILSKRGHVFYLSRRGDLGSSAYEVHIYSEYKGEILGRFTNRQPTGSRANVRAKGDWKHGKWTVEFGRSLNTDHTDDIQFETTGSYLFGISRYEATGKKPNPNEHPYGTGDVSEKLTLRFGS